jgi:iron complex outermembrane receptor protein
MRLRVVFNVLGLMVWAVIAVCLLGATSYALSITGTVIDAETGEPVVAATVRISGTGIGVMSGEDGRFELNVVRADDADLVVQHIAYRLWRRSLDALETPAEIRLTPVVLPGQDIVVTSTRAVRGQSPVAFDNITEEEIRQSYYAQDVPQLLQESPSVYSYSDNGNAIGYSYMSIRGFSQRRVSVLINGVPLNDPESHEVYWIDLPDLPASIEDAQIQRGVGTTLYGANSIGGTVNLQTDHYSPVRDFKFTSGFGSYDTRKFSIEANSGLIDERYTLYGRYSRIVSDGYRNDAWTDLWSYFFAAARYDEKWTNRVNLFGGPEQTHLAYTGVPRFYLEGDVAAYNASDEAKLFSSTPPTGDPDVDRRYNQFEWDGATDNFNQPQYQWLMEYRPDSNWLFENTLFYIKGKGFFDELWYFVDLPYFQLDPFETDTGTVTVSEQTWPRLWVENDFWGVIPRVTRTHTHGALTVGAEFQRHRSLQWGEVQSVRPAPPGFVPGHRYYDYKGRKMVLTGFAQEVYTPVPEITLTGALQYSFKRYEVTDNQIPNLYGQTVTHTTDYSFISPRFGVMVRPRPDLSVFGSVSYNEQEPTNREVFNPADPYANAESFFENYNAATGVGDDPIMKPERLIDYELGAAVSRARWRVEINGYYMIFKDEIVPNGQISQIDGLPIRANAPSSTHRGIELAVEAHPHERITVRGNLAINDNTFDEFTEYLWDGSTVDRSGNVIAGFPEHLANLRVTYEDDYFMVSGRMFRAGKQYIDNSNSPETEIDPYTIFNARGELKLEQLFPYPGLTLFVQVNNVLDEEYETGGSIGWLSGLPLFVPAAKRNFFAGIRAGL